MCVYMHVHMDIQTTHIYINRYIHVSSIYIYIHTHILCKLGTFMVFYVIYGPARSQVGGVGVSAWGSGSERDGPSRSLGFS